LKLKMAAKLKEEKKKGGKMGRMGPTSKYGRGRGQSWLCWAHLCAYHVKSVSGPLQLVSKITYNTILHYFISSHMLILQCLKPYKLLQWPGIFNIGLGRSQSCLCWDHLCAYHVKSVSGPVTSIGIENHI
jgi:hypothetical protein